MNLNKIKAEKFNSIIFFTGAGMSKESNIDTFKGEGGIWDNYNWREFACQNAFIKNPLKVQKFHEMRRKEIFDKNNIDYDGEISLVPQNFIQLSLDEADKVIKLLELIENHDDVQKVHTNFQIK